MGIFSLSERKSVSFHFFTYYIFGSVFCQFFVVFVPPISSPFIFVFLNQSFVLCAHLFWNIPLTFCNLWSYWWDFKKWYMLRVNGSPQQHDNDKKQGMGQGLFAYASCNKVDHNGGVGALGLLQCVASTFKKAKRFTSFQSLKREWKQHNHEDNNGGAKGQVPKMQWWRWAWMVWSWCWGVGHSMEFATMELGNGGNDPPPKK
jgi:hypothetical protein